MQEKNVKCEEAAEAPKRPEETAVKTADVEKKAANPLGAGAAGASIDDVTALKISLVLTETIDYPLPPVIGD